MAKSKKSVAPVTPLVVAPPPPQAKAVLATRTAGTKHPLDPRENPAARDSRGKPSRAEIRRETARVAAPRASGRRPERHSQPRSKIAKSKPA